MHFSLHLPALSLFVSALSLRCVSTLHFEVRPLSLRSVRTFTFCGRTLSRDCARDHLHVVGEAPASAAPNPRGSSTRRSRALALLPVHAQPRHVPHAALCPRPSLLDPSASPPASQRGCERGWATGTDALTKLLAQLATRAPSGDDVAQATLEIYREHSSTRLAGDKCAAAHLAPADLSATRPPIARASTTLNSRTCPARCAGGSYPDRSSAEPSRQLCKAS